MLNKLKFLVIFFSLIFFLTSVRAEFNIKARTAILQDYLSGQIHYEKNPNLSIFPASMTKIMTTIIAFELLQKGDLDLQDKFFVSEMHGDFQRQVIPLCL